MPHIDIHDYLLSRDAKSDITPNATQKVTLIVAGCYVIAIAILWWVCRIPLFFHPKALPLGRHVPFLSWISTYIRRVYSRRN